MHYLTTQVLARPARPQPRARERMRARQPRIVICAFSSSVLGAAPHRMLTHFWRAHAQMRPPGGKAASCVHAAFPPGGGICAAPCRAAPRGCSPVARSSTLAAGCCACRRHRTCTTPCTSTPPSKASRAHWQSRSAHSTLHLAVPGVRAPHFAWQSRASVNVRVIDLPGCAGETSATIVYDQPCRHQHAQSRERAHLQRAHLQRARVHGMRRVLRAPSVRARYVVNAERDGKAPKILATVA
jgi:hypothetical protein